MTYLHWSDIFILVTFFLVTLTIAIYHALSGGRQRTVEEYLLANRKLKVLPTVVSLVVSLRSAVTVIGVPAEIYSWGTQLWFCGEFVSGALILVIIERFFLSWLFHLKLISIYEYLRLRYRSKSVQRVASSISIFASISYNGIVILSPAIAMQIAAGVPIKMSILLMTGFCMVYTTLGGLRGVVWNDVIQCGIMVAGLLFILIQGCKEVGGFQRVISVSKKAGRLFFTSFNPDPTVRISFWSVLFGGTPFLIYLLGLQQMMFQRYTSVPKLMDARILLWLSIPLGAVFSSIVGLVGLVQVGYFFSINCDPFASGLIHSPNQIFPLFMKMHFHSFYGIRGLFLMTLCSASVSTISSVLNGSAANTWEDFIKPAIGKHLTEFQSTIVIKALVIIYSVICAVIATFAVELPNNILILASMILATTAGPVMGVFLLGGLTKMTEWIGALTGAIVGFTLVLLIACGRVFSSPLVFVSYPSFLTSGCPTGTNQTLYYDAVNVDNSTFIVRGSEKFGKSRPDQFLELVEPVNGLKWLFSISTFYYTTVGMIATMIVGSVTSFIVNRAKGRKHNEVDDKYLIPMWQVFCVSARNHVKEFIPNTDNINI